MNIEKLKTINSTNPVVANAIKACIEKNACEDQVVENYGTSEGARKAAETRKRGGGATEDHFSDHSIQATYGDDGKIASAKLMRHEGTKATQVGTFSGGAWDDAGAKHMSDKAGVKGWADRFTSSHGMDTEAGRASAEREAKMKANYEAWKKAKASKNASEGQRLHSTNPVVESALAYAANKACANQDQAPEDPAVVENYGTSEGARKAAETRKRGGGVGDGDYGTRFSFQAKSVEEKAEDSHMRERFNQETTKARTAREFAKREDVTPKQRDAAIADADRADVKRKAIIQRYKKILEKRRLAGKDRNVKNPLTSGFDY